MPILGFKEKFQEAILNGTKRQTIRYNLDYWWKILHATFTPKWHREHDKLYPDDQYAVSGCEVNLFQNKSTIKIWCPGPRSGNGKHLFDTNNFIIAGAYGNEFHKIKDLATLDGFSNLDDLISELMNMHKLTREEFDAHMWAVIRWRSKGETTNNQQGPGDEPV